MVQGWNKIRLDIAGWLGALQEGAGGMEQGGMERGAGWDGGGCDEK